VIRAWYNTFMEIEGHFQDGVIIPHDGVSLPNGTEVTIMVHTLRAAESSTMTAEERKRYLTALARIDALPNERPGDHFSGADHDRVLYGDGT
jgi:predicted DNA-binding antitoxin AbrB/MazE fold protein